MRNNFLKRSFVFLLAIAVIASTFVNCLFVSAADVQDSAGAPFYRDRVINQNVTAFASGTGTEADPYVITNGDQLALAAYVSSTMTPTLSEKTIGKYFVLGNDIYLNGNSETNWANVNWSTGKMDDDKNIKRWLYQSGNDEKFRFKGTFDGKGYSVYGLFEDASATGGSRVGLFPVLGEGAVVKNVNVDHCFFRGGNVGAIAGEAGGSTKVTISHCGVGSDVKLRSEKTDANGGCGGLVGTSNIAADFDNCYFIGIIDYINSPDGNGARQNAFTGSTSKKLTFTNCFSTDYLLVRSSRVSADSIVFTNVYAQKSQNGTVTVLTADQMKGDAAKINMTGFDFDKDWQTNAGAYPTLKYVEAEEIDTTVNTASSPYYINAAASATDMSGEGTKENPYVITTAKQLAKVCLPATPADTVGKYYVLGNDIYLNGSSSTNWANVSWSTGKMDDGKDIKRWLTTGGDTKYFRGNFNGHGYTVYGLFEDAGVTGNARCALIPVLGKDGVVTNVNIDHSYISGGGVAAVVGIITNNADSGARPVVKNCGVNGDVTIKANGNVSGLGAGGVVGIVMNTVSNIENCYFNGTLSGYTTDNNAASGLKFNAIVGEFYTDSACELKSCYSAKDYRLFHRNGSKALPNQTGLYGRVAYGTVTVVAEADMKGTAAKTNMPNLNWDYFVTNDNAYPTLKYVAEEIEPEVQPIENTAVSPYYKNIDHAAIGFASGDGSVANPYHIKTAEQLAKACYTFRDGSKNKNYVLDNDIYVNGDENTNWANVSWSTGKMDDGTTDIKRWLSYNGTGAELQFIGNFDGQGHTVYGLFEDFPTVETNGKKLLTGLFPLIGKGAVVKNVNVDNAYLRGCCVGPVVAQACIGNTGATPTVANCGVGENVTVVAQGNVGGCASGGVVGIAMSVAVNISNCYFNGTLSGYNASSVDKFNGILGGIYMDDAASSVVGCYTSKAYRILQRNTNNATVQTALYTLAAPVSGYSYTQVASADNMKGAAAKTSMPGLDWRIAYKTNENTYPTVITGIAYAGGNGTQESPYQVSTAAQLAKVVNLKSAESLGKYFVLTNDIDVDSNIPWYAVSASDADCFCGNFDGQGHKVTGLSYSNTGSASMWVATGLFPKIGEGAHIKNVAVENSNLTITNGSVGGIVGSINTAKAYSGADIVKRPSITACFVGSDVALSSTRIGGIVGIEVGECDIIDCYFGGTLTFTGANQGDKRLGAAVGTHWANYINITRFASFNYDVVPTNIIDTTHLYNVYTTTDVVGTSDAAVKKTVAKKITLDDMKNNAFYKMPNLNWKDGFLIWTEGELPSYDLTKLNNYHQYVVGDTNGDGQIAAADLAALKSAILGIQFSCSTDVNYDGKINILDIVYMKKMIVSAPLYDVLKTAVIVYNDKDNFESDAAELLRTGIVNNAGINIQKSNTDVQGSKVVFALDNNLAADAWKVTFDGSVVTVAAGSKGLLVTAASEFVSILSVDYLKDLSLVDGLSGAVTDFAATKTVDGKTYNLVWNDEFSGSALNGKYWGTRRTNEASNITYKNDASTVNVSNGKLQLNAYYDESTGKYILPDTLTAIGSMSYKYGYLEMYAKLPGIKGAWNALWLTSKGSKGDNPNADYNVEIDAFETVVNGKTLKPNIHKWYGDEDIAYNNDPNSLYNDVSYSDKAIKTATFDENEYHLFGFLWNESEMTVYVDGNAYMTFDMTDDFENYDETGNDETGMTGFNTPLTVLIGAKLYTSGNDAVSAASLPTSTQIDWIRLYQDDAGTLNR